jgi:hypothetical protein
MGANQPERRKADRRKNPGGTPPPGTVVDRRLGLDQRAQPKRDMVTGLERARGAGRRLSDFTKAAEEGEMTPEQFLFLMAIDAFKKSNDRMFPTWTDVLEVIRLLGYRKTMASELNLANADDWRERPDAPANVRPQRWAERFHKKSEREMADEAIAEFEAQFDNDFDDDLENAA